MLNHPGPPTSVRDAREASCLVYIPSGNGDKAGSGKADGAMLPAAAASDTEEIAAAAATAATAAAAAVGAAPPLSGGDELKQFCGVAAAAAAAGSGGWCAACKRRSSWSRSVAALSCCKLADNTLQLDIWLCIVLPSKRPPSVLTASDMKHPKLLAGSFCRRLAISTAVNSRSADPAPDCLAVPGLPGRDSKGTASAGGAAPFVVGVRHPKQPPDADQT